VLVVVLTQHRRVVHCATVVVGGQGRVLGVVMRGWRRAHLLLLWRPLLLTRRPWSTAVSHRVVGCATGTKYHGLLRRELVRRVLCDRKREN